MFGPPGAQKQEKPMKIKKNSNIIFFPTVSVVVVRFSSVTSSPSSPPPPPPPLLRLPLSDLFRARAPPYRRPVQLTVPIGDDGQLMSSGSSGRPVL